MGEFLTLKDVAEFAAGENYPHVYFLSIKASFREAATVAKEVARHDPELPFTQYVRWTTELMNPEATVLAAVKIPAIDNDNVSAFENLNKLVEYIRTIPGVLNPTTSQAVGGKHFPGGDEPEPTPVNGWP